MDPVAIVGIGCRIPGARGPEAMWERLRAGCDLVTEIPPERRSPAHAGDGTASSARMPSRAGSVTDIDRFDHQAFRISFEEACALDPQQRLVMEAGWDALDDAGLPFERVAGTRTGVFVGIAPGDYGRITLERLDAIGPYTNTGSFLSIAASRLSYFFDLHGPSVALDTACSSSLVAVHLACQSLATGESEMALAGGVNALISPGLTIGFTKIGALSPDGECRPFSSQANGYVRAEGAALVVLKPLAAARRDGDRIYAIILGSAINNDGRTNGLTAPSRHGQEAVLREAYARAGVSPGDVQYVEAHGTGTLIGDPIELGALSAIVGQNRPRRRRCAIGSAKANFGHLETAAGVVGLAKTALALQHRQIPPSLHAMPPNPHVDLAGLRLEVQQTLDRWPRGRPLAGVSAFGFGGTNAHVVLAAAPRVRRPTRTTGAAPGWLLLSACGPAALSEYAAALADFIPRALERGVALGEICYSAAVRRSHLQYRVAVRCHGYDETVAALRALASGESHPDVRLGSHSTSVAQERSKVAPPEDADVALYLTGGDVDWAARLGRRPWVRLPAYPWQRERCWFDIGSASADTSDDSRWSRLVDAARQELRVPDGHAPSADDLATLAGAVDRHVVTALRRLGVEWNAGSAIEIDRWLDEGRIDRTYRRWLTRRIAGLEARGLVRRSSRGHEVIAQPGAAGDREDMPPTIAARFDIELSLMERTADRLADILAGRLDPTEVFFDGGESSMADRLYARTFARTNEAVRAASVEHATRLAQRGLSIVEVGAGVGATTGRVLDAMRRRGVRYCYTDISQFFLQLGRARFGAAMGFDARRLDIEHDPRRQGFAPGAADAVIASSALHAARDLAAAVRHVRCLLRPRGVAILVEPTAFHDIFDLTIGLLPGFDRFDDFRRAQPFASPDEWTEVLRQEGFARVEWLPDAGSNEWFGLGVLLAQADTAPAAAAVPYVDGARADVDVKPGDVDPPESSVEVMLRGMWSDLLERDVAGTDNFFDLGGDSLVAGQLLNRVEQHLGVALGATEVFDAPTPRALAARIEAALRAGASRAHA